MKSKQRELLFPTENIFIFQLKMQIYVSFLGLYYNPEKKNFFHPYNSYNISILQLKNVKIDKHHIFRKNIFLLNLANTSITKIVRK